MCHTAKDKAFEPNFFALLISVPSDMKVKENENKLIMTFFSGWYFLKSTGHYGPPPYCIGLKKTTSKSEIFSDIKFNVV